jgi:antitoxin (DNA-binding transcriptional repressor) of toxin-antitoxin stability system
VSVTRIDLGSARVVSMRELSQHTATVIEEINKSGEAAVLTRHGLFVALITPLAGRRIESIVLAKDEQVRELVNEAESRAQEGTTRGMPIEATEAWLDQDGASSS